MQIPRYNRQVGISTAQEAAQVPEGFGTDEFRAMAQFGDSLNEVGKVLQGMQELSDQKTLMDMNVQAAMIQNELDSDKFSSQVNPKDYAQKYDFEYQKRITDMVNNTDAPSHLKDYFLKSAELKRIQNSGRVVQKQEQMIYDATKLSYSKQVDVLKNSIKFEDDINTLSATYNAARQDAQIQGKASKLGTNELVSVDNNIAKTTLKRASDYIDQMMESNNELEARKTLEFLNSERLITPEEYKQKSTDLHVDIALTQANKAFLSGDAKGAKANAESIETKGLTEKQLKERKQIIDNSERELNVYSGQVAKDVIQKMRTSDMTPSEKQKAAVEFYAQLNQPNISDETYRAMDSKIQGWLNNKKESSDDVLQSKLYTRISTVHTRTSQDEIDNLDTELNNSLSKLDGNSYLSLKKMLSDRLDEVYVDNIKIGLKNAGIFLPTKKMERENDVRQYISDYTAKHGMKPSPADVYVRVMEGYSRPTDANVVKVKTIDEAKKLPKGTIFEDPNGRRYRR